MLTTHQLQPKYLESVTARCTFHEFLTSSSQTPSFICIRSKFFDSWNMGCFDNFMAAQHNGKTDFFHDEEEVSSLKKVLFSFPFVRQMNCRVHNLCALKAPTFIAQFTSTHIHMHNCNKDLSISEAFSFHPA